MVKPKYILNKKKNTQNFDFSINYKKNESTCLIKIDYPEVLSSAIPKITSYLNNYFTTFNFDTHLCDVSFSFSYTKDDIQKILSKGNKVSLTRIPKKNEVLKGVQMPFLVSDDWGISITTTIIKLDDVIKAQVFDESYITVEHLNGQEGMRTITSAWVSDEQGNKVTYPMEYIAINMMLHPDEGSPIQYNKEKNQNSFAEPFQMKVTFEDCSVESMTGKIYDTLEIDMNVHVCKSMICNQLKGWEMNVEGFPTSQGKISYAFYKPKKKTHKCAMIIWNHGGAEWGNDPYVNLLNNKVTALSSKEFQKIFDGCYILAPQRNSMSSGTTPLVQLIKYILKQNPDIDENRVIIGGSSMGGIITNRLIGEHSDMFAAAFSICGGSMDEQLLPNVKDMPIWIIQARNDPVAPFSESEKYVEQLKKIGNTQWHTSFFPDVHDYTGRFHDEEGRTLLYNGHWSWIYFFGNMCFDQNYVKCWEWLAKQVKKKI